MYIRPMLFQRQSNPRRNLGRVVYQGCFLASSLALVLLGLKSARRREGEMRRVGMERKTFYDLSSGNLWCHVCDIFCLRIYFFFGFVSFRSTFIRMMNGTPKIRKCCIRFRVASVETLFVESVTLDE